MGKFKELKDEASELGVLGSIRAFDAGMGEAAREQLKSLTTAKGWADLIRGLVLAFCALSFLFGVSRYSGSVWFGLGAVFAFYGIVHYLRSAWIGVGLTAVYFVVVHYAL